MDETVVNPGRQVTPYNGDESDLVVLVRTVWKHRLMAGLITTACLLVALYLAITTVPTYRADVIVTAVRADATSRGALANTIGAITSLVGMNFSEASNENDEANAVLDSRHLVEELVSRDSLLPVLSHGAKKPLTLWRAVTRFKQGNLSIRRDQRRGVTTVSVVWTDPAVAARWANQLVDLANELLRARAIDNATRDIAYLNHQIEQTNSVELRAALYDIIKNETKTLMLATGRSDYAFEVVDPAVAPELKAGPHRTLMVLAGLGLGLILSSLIALTIEWTHRLRRSAV